MELVQLDSISLPVIIFIITVTLSELIHVFTLRYAALILIGYSILCICVPAFCLVLPIFVYDTLSIKRYPLLIVLTISFITGIISLASHQIVFTLLMTLIAVILFWRSDTAAHLKKLLTEQRDQAEEFNLLLAAKNRSILEQQDNEIYMATLKERNRIAREIHDNVGHSLTRSLLQIGALKVINKDDNLRESIDSIHDTLSSAMTSIRSSVHNLHDTTIHLKNMVNECIAPLLEKFDVHLEYSVSEYAPKNIKLCLIGIVKESVSNIVKHSNGDTVSVVLREHPAFYQLIIKDNGRSCTQIRETGMGLSGMRERAENAGGIFSASASEEGFRIFVSIPKNNKE